MNYGTLRWKEPEFLTLESAILTLHDMRENSTVSFKQDKSIILIQRTIGDSEDMVCNSGTMACESFVI